MDQNREIQKLKFFILNKNNNFDVNIFVFIAHFQRKKIKIVKINTVIESCSIENLYKFLDMSHGSLGVPKDSFRNNQDIPAISFDLPAKGFFEDPPDYNNASRYTDKKSHDSSEKFPELHTGGQQPHINLSQELVSVRDLQSHHLLK